MFFSNVATMEQPRPSNAGFFVANIKIEFQSPPFCPLFRFLTSVGIDNSIVMYYSLVGRLVSRPLTACTKTPLTGAFFLFAETHPSRPVFILTIGKMREQTRNNCIRLHGRNKPSINSSRFRRRMERLLIALPKDGLIFHTPPFINTLRYGSISTKLQTMSLLEDNMRLRIALLCF